MILAHDLATSSRVGSETPSALAPCKDDLHDRERA